MEKKFIAYYRVSTARQGRSGLSLESQKADVMEFISGNGELISEYTEVESGGKNERKEVLKAIDECLKTGATLVIAKLDRLSRNVIFIETLREKGVKFICCDMPEVTELVISIMAVLAQDELKRIKARIHKAFEAKRARGEKWGGSSKEHCEYMLTCRKSAKIDENIKYVITEELGKGKKLEQVAEILNSLGHRTVQDKPFTKVQVMRLRDRIAA